jgi:ssDNA-binding Zn-finger/Zn-ribbon topoisomerase 1
MTRPKLAKPVKCVSCGGQMKLKKCRRGYILVCKNAPRCRRVEAYELCEPDS